MVNVQIKEKYNYTLHTNFDYLLNKVTDHSDFSNDNIELLSNIVKNLTDENNNGNVNRQYIALNNTIDDWKKNLNDQINRQNSSDLENLKEYNLININNKELVILKITSVPTSYLVFLCLFISMFFITSTIFVVGLLMKQMIINFGLNILLIIGSLGMIITVIIAICEWKCLVNEKSKRRRKIKSVK